MIFLEDGFTDIEVVRYEKSDIYDNVVLPGGNIAWSKHPIMIHHLEYPTINFSWPVGVSNNLNVYMMVYDRPFVTLIDQRPLGNFNPLALGITHGISMSLRPAGQENIFFPYILMWVHNADIVAQTFSAEIHGTIK